MLEIVLLILKIAGIILVSFLGILIVVICFALFVPVRYRGDFLVSDAEDGKKKKVDVSLRAVWLLRLVRVYVTCEKAVRVRVKLLFFTLMDTARERKDKTPKKERGEKTGRRTEAPETCGEDKEERGETGPENDTAQSKAAGGNSGADEKTPETCGEDKEAREETGPESDTAQAKATGENSGAGREAAETGGEETAGSENKTVRRKSQKQDEAKDGIISRILQTVRNFCDKLRGIKEKVERAETLLASDHMVNSRNLLGRQLVYLIRHTKPKRLSGYLRFGFADPAVTGYAMAVYGILLPIWSPKLSVEPDFEKQLLDCHILLKGKIRVWHFVRVALRMFFSGDVRRVIKDIRKFGKA